MGGVEEAGETGSEAERCQWRIKRSGGSGRNRAMQAKRSTGTIETAGVSNGSEQCDV